MQQQKLLTDIDFDQVNLFKQAKVNNVNFSKLY